MENLCECGCGSATSSPAKRFVSGHNGRGIKRKPLGSFACIHCGTAHEVMPHLARRKFCNTDCRDQYRRLQTGEAHPLFKRPIVPCAHCGRMFERKKHGNKRLAYCSVECGNAAKSRKLSESGKRRHGDTLDHHKKAARERDGGACRMCGFELVTHVHHIIPKAQGGPHTETNLITLCPNHHAMAHAGLLPEHHLLAAMKGGIAPLAQF